jgi:hypothetical protein
VGTTTPPQQVAASPDGSSANGTGDSIAPAPLSEIKAG